MAQAMDGDVQTVVGQFLVPVAQRLDQLRATGDAIGAQRQRFEQAELARGQLQRPAIDPGAVAGQVQPQSAQLQFRLALAADPAQQGAHARLELAQRERLDQVIVGAQVEHADAFGQAVARGHHQHRQALAAAAQALQHLAAIQPRQAQVQHQQVVAVIAQRGVSLAAVRDVVHGMPAPAQRGADALGDGGIVFHQQDAHGDSDTGESGDTTRGCHSGAQFAGSCRSLTTPAARGSSGCGFSSPHGSARR